MSLQLLPERLAAKIAVAEDGCWVWLASRDRLGYGRAFHDGRMRLAHRVVFVLLCGDPGPTLDHLCRNPSCVNPAHLESVTQAENVRRGAAGAVNGARLRSLTHCKRGHEFTAANTRIDGRGHRSCRACARLLHRSYYHADLTKSREYERQKHARRTRAKKGE